MRKSLIAGAVALSMLSANAYALSVGSMEIDSHLGEPLDISIGIDSIDQDEFSTLEVSLASREMFREAGIEYPRDASKLQLELGPYDNGRVTISVKTAGAISNPFLHLLLSISWSGGNILREYTALIDPSDYEIEPIMQAAAPETRLGLTKPVSATSQDVTETQFRTVQPGESLSLIAAFYRPSDVAAEQLWLAIFNLNQDAFPDANLNRLQKGARLQIPTVAQMKVVSAAEAVKQVAALTRPLVGAETAQKSGLIAQKPKAATLVVGGGGDEMAADSSRQSAQSAPLGESELQNGDELASADSEWGAITQTINKEINDSRDRDFQLKEELIAARGENKVLTDRMARLEAQLSRMSQLLELQSNAIQALNSNLEKSNTALIFNSPQGQLDPVVTIAPVDQFSKSNDSQKAYYEKLPDEALSEAHVETPARSDNDTPKTYYEELLEVAISDAPEEDVSYIEEVLGLSSTSIGQKDANPVTAEMRAKAAANAPASPTAPVDEATAAMLANVRASLGQAPSASGNVVPDTKSDVQITGQDSAYIDALNAKDRSQIEKSEARIAELQKQLQAKIDAAQNITTDVSTVPLSLEAGAGSATTANATQQPSETSLVSSIMERSSSALSGLMAMAGGVSQDIWRLIGGIAVAAIGFMVLLGLRRRKEVEKVTSGAAQDSEFSDSSIDIADIATKRMQLEPDDSEGFEEELHGSSLFDLSDESFMASEVIQDDSSLFSIDDNDDSLADMDSTQIGRQSTMQAVDVDPIAEADVYLAYDRKEQAIEVLEQALSRSPNQSAVVVKLLGLYQAEENIESFTRLFEVSAEHVEDESDRNKIKLMAKDFIPGHEMLADDFDTSIPVLLDEITDKSKLDSSLTPDLKLASSKDKTRNLGEADAMESLNISLEEDESIQLDHELDHAVKEINQHEPDTALTLAKAYIELGEEDIARDFLRDVISGGDAGLKLEAQEILAKL